MNNFKNKAVLNISYAAIIAALYVVLTLIFAPFSFYAIQVRLSEALCILPMYTFAAVPGIFIGCLLANMLAGAALMDIIFGSLASLLAAYITYLLRKRKILPFLSPIVINAIAVPFILKYAYALPDAILYMAFTVAVGEIIAVALIGGILKVVLDKYKADLFKNMD